MTPGREPGFVWVVCLCGKRPDLSILGVYTTEEAMIEALKPLPRENWYNLYKVPLNQFLGFWHKDGRLLDGMGRLWHHHLLPPEPENDTWLYVDGWPRAGELEE